MEEGRLGGVNFGLDWGGRGNRRTMIVGLVFRRGITGRVMGGGFWGGGVSCFVSRSSNVGLELWLYTTATATATATAALAPPLPTTTATPGQLAHRHQQAEQKQNQLRSTMATDAGISRSRPRTRRQHLFVKESQFNRRPRRGKKLC